MQPSMAGDATPPSAPTSPRTPHRGSRGGPLVAVAGAAALIRSARSSCTTDVPRSAAVVASSSGGSSCSSSSCGGGGGCGGGGAAAAAAGAGVTEPASCWMRSTRFASLGQALARSTARCRCARSPGAACRCSRATLGFQVVLQPGLRARRRLGRVVVDADAALDTLDEGLSAAFLASPRTASEGGRRVGEAARPEHDVDREGAAPGVDRSRPPVARRVAPGLEGGQPPERSPRRGGVLHLRRRGVRSARLIRPHAARRRGPPPGRDRVHHAPAAGGRVIETALGELRARPRPPRARAPPAAGEEGTRPGCRPARRTEKGPATRARAGRRRRGGALPRGHRSGELVPRRQAATPLPGGRRPHLETVTFANAVAFRAHLRRADDGHVVPRRRRSRRRRARSGPLAGGLDAGAVERDRRALWY